MVIKDKEQQNILIKTEEEEIREVTEYLKEGRKEKL